MEQIYVSLAMEWKDIDNNKEGLPIVLQEWQRLDLIKTVLCATREPYTKKELSQAKYFLTRDL